MSEAKYKFDNYDYPFRGMPSGLTNNSKLWMISSGHFAESYSPEMPAPDGQMLPVVFEHLEFAREFDNGFWQWTDGLRTYSTITVEKIKSVVVGFWLGVVLPGGTAMVSLINSDEQLTISGVHSMVTPKATGLTVTA